MLLAPLALRLRSGPNQRSFYRYKLFLEFFMNCVFFTPAAMLFDFDFALDFPLILTGPVIDALALFALELNQIVL